MGNASRGTFLLSPPSQSCLPRPRLPFSGSPPSHESSACSGRGPSPESNRLERREEAAVAGDTPPAFVLRCVSPRRPQRMSVRFPWKGGGVRETLSWVGLRFLGRQAWRGQRDRKQRKLLKQSQEERAGWSLPCSPASGQRGIPAGCCVGGAPARCSYSAHAQGLCVSFSPGRKDSVGENGLVRLHRAETGFRRGQVSCEPAPGR